MTINWNHIQDKQPEDGRSIIQIDQPYQGHYTMGMREYSQKCSWEKILEHSNKFDWPKQDFWWVYREDFPFPTQKDSRNCEKMMDKYSLEELIKTFKSHAKKSNEINKEMIKNHRKAYPDSPIPSHFNDEFSLPTALCYICEEILSLKSKKDS